MAGLTETLAKSGVHTYPLDVPLDAGSRQAIDMAIWAIRRNIENDDSCDDDECTEENPKCQDMEMRVALKNLESVLNPDYRSLNPDRLGNPAEDVFVRRWQKENERVSSVNHGYASLELILTPTRIRRESPRGWHDSPYYVPPVSQRDAEVATTVIQWLGTSCGLSFMLECEREIKEAKAERRDMEHERHLNVFQKQRILPSHENLAREAAMSALRADDPKYDKLVSAIIAAIQATVGAQPEFIGAGI